MELIIYRKGEVFTVLYDECDQALIKSNKWTISSDGYVVAYKKCKAYFMHRLIMQTPDGFVTDHKNRIKHDNRRENLRICTPSENQANKAAYGGRKYRGVSFDKASNKFRATIVASGRTIYLGTFSLEEDAARAYDSAAKYYFGEFANPNLPGEPIAEYAEKTIIEGGRKRPIKFKDYEAWAAKGYKLKLAKELWYGDVAKIAKMIGCTRPVLLKWFNSESKSPLDEIYRAKITDFIEEKWLAYKKLIKAAMRA